MISNHDLGFDNLDENPNADAASGIPETLSQVDEGPIRSISADNLKIQEAARTSLDFLAGLAMPDTYKYEFPPIFLGIWQWLTSYALLIRDFSQLAIGLPRGFSKTTVLKLFILWCILFTKKTFILYIAGTQTKANDAIGDIADMLDEPNIKAVFGDWRVGLIIDRADFKLFGFRGRNIILRGAGAGSDIRGIVRKNHRPDVMAFDDVQTAEDAQSEVISTQIENWMQGTAMKAKSPEGCLFIFIANMYPSPFSILKRIIPNPNWLKFITGAITNNGESLWEALHPLKQLLREYVNDQIAGKAQIFRAEVLNDIDASLNNSFDISKIPAYNIPDDEQHQGNFIIIDPATDKPGADDVSIGYFEIHEGFSACKEVDAGNYSPGDTIKHALKIALERNCRVIGIEGTAYQFSLCYWFGFICQLHGIIGIEAVELPSSRNSKIATILAMFKQLLSGEVKIHPKCRPLIDIQIINFNPLKRDNTDGLLDLLKYAPKMIEMYGPLISSSLTIENQEYEAIEIVGPEVNCSF